MKHFNSATDILALDFDGVIADSIQECLVSGHNAYCTFSNRGEPVERFEELDPSWAAEARRMRNFIRHGEDYLYIAHALAKDITIEEQQDFDNFLKEHQDLRRKFFDLMTMQRISFSATRPEQWAALNPLYHGMRQFLANYAKKENLYIITTKKLLFVFKILTAYNIKLIDENIRDTSDGVTKRHLIEEILADRKVRPDQFYFIDDQVDTLIRVKPTGVHAMLAGWGYNNPQQRELARRQDISVLTLSCFMRQFI
ncbi:HAD family hydrolase [candidate division KSB1 bacterium]|nr:HAD family hydrolase [candidate division KSB1 bacterium]